MSSLKKYILFLFSIVITVQSCNKDKSAEAKTNTVTVNFPACKPIPLLTGKYWKTDTVLINPPVMYDQLSDEDKNSYKGALSWFRLWGIRFNTDCSFSEPVSDWDSGFDKWALTENNKDLQVLLRNGKIDTLLNFSVDAAKFMYERKFKPFTLTFILK
jgi:hypothetical protein